MKINFTPVGTEGVKLGVSIGYGSVTRGDLNDLPLKNIEDGSIFYDMDSANVYMFIANVDPTKNGEWKLQ